MAINELTRLSASTVFKTTRSTSEIKKTLDSINAEESKIDPATVTNAIGIIEKRTRYAGKIKILEAFIGGTTTLLFTNERIPSYISTFPYVSKTSPNVLRVGVIANKAIGADKTDITNVATFYALMQTGYLRRQLMLNFDKYTSNSKLQMSSAVAYSRLASRVMDKLFSINVDKTDSDIISYMFAKFCLIRMMGKVDGQLTNSIAAKAAFNGTSLNYLEEKEATYKKDNPEMYGDIFRLFSAISSKHKVNIRSFISDYARMYGEASLLALDFYPAFIEMISAVAVNGYLYNDLVIRGTLNSLVDEVHANVFFIN